MCERCNQLEKQLAEGKQAHEDFVLGIQRFAQNATAGFVATYGQEDEKVPA